MGLTGLPGAERETGATSPFLFLADSRGRDVGWAVVAAPIWRREGHRRLAELSAAGYRFAGMTNYFDFPGPAVGDGRDYGLLCEAWLHCFRDPEKRLPRGVPAARVALSDFTDYRSIRPAPGARRKDHGVLYAGASPDWKKEAKNWALAARCIPRLVRELGLTAVAIGRPDERLAAAPGVEIVPFLPWDRFLDVLQRSRVLFVPNVRDPSPRVLAEALCLDVPIVVNRAILGGWHYVSEATGAFFDDEASAVAAVRRCLDEPLAPRRWFCERFGPERAGRRALELIRQVDPEIAERSHLTISSAPPAGSPLRG